MLQLVKVLQFFAQLIYVGLLDSEARLIVLVSQLACQLIFCRFVVKGANVKFVAATLITLHVLVLVRMIQAFHSGVTLGTLQAERTLVPPQIAYQRFTIFGHIPEQVWRASKITSVVGKNARF